MLKNTCCSICLSIDKRNIDIYATDLQHIYENLANFKLSVTECWMCYICHSRLRQCYQLQQLAIQTRGLVDDFIQNKIDIKFGAIRSMLELSISKTKITSCIKEKSDEETEFNVDDGNSHDEKTINCDEERKPHNQSEDTLSQELADVVKTDTLQTFKGHDMKLVETSQVVSVENISQNKESYVATKGLECRDKTTVEDHTEKEEIKQEVQEEIGDKGIHHHDQRDTAMKYKLRDHVNFSQSGSYDEDPLSCYFCLRKFPYKSKLLTHIRIHTGEKPFGCHICSKKFSLKMNLKRHVLLTHTGVQTFTCDICSKKFSNDVYLSRHMLIHADEKLFSCDTCSKRFTQKIQLNRHRLIHIRDNPLSCDVCSKKFSHRSHLIGHQRIHTGDKPFRCNICSNKFAQKSTLKRHMVTHTGDQPFKCEICKKKFVCKSSLDNHTLIHTGVKKFICHICGKKFTLKRYLNIHVQSHMGVKRFSCDVCSKKFTQKSSLNTHKRVL